MLSRRVVKFSASAVVRSRHNLTAHSGVRRDAPSNGLTDRGDATTTGLDQGGKHRAATIVGPVSPHTMKAKGLFSKFLYWNFIKVGRCLSNGKIAMDPAPFVKKMSE